MTTTWTQGTTATLAVLWREYAPDGPLHDVNNLTITITRLATGAAVVGPTAAGVAHPATGAYTYLWATSTLNPAGDYLVTWNATDPNTADPISTSEIVTLVTAAAAGSPTGLCLPWDPIWCCDLSAMTPTITGQAVQIASEILFHESGMRFGLCQVTLRPCRRTCDAEPWRYPAFTDFGSWVAPTLVGGEWFNIACGTCGDGCSCTSVSEVMLPGPVYDVVQVLIDGVPLDSAAYRLDDGRLLVRVDGGQWPICNDLSKNDDEVGTWSITARFGEPVPQSGQAAVGELACEVGKALACDDTCGLPPNVQTLVRQGVTVTMPEGASADIRNRLFLVGLFLNWANPNGIGRSARVYDIDGPGFRRPT